MVAQAHGLAAEADLMGAVLLGDHFADREVAAVEVPDVARADAEEAGNDMREISGGAGAAILMPASGKPKGALESDPPRCRASPKVLLIRGRRSEQ